MRAASALEPAAEQTTANEGTFGAASDPGRSSPPGSRDVPDQAVRSVQVGVSAAGVVTAPVYCTKIASKLVRTYTDRHGLKELVRELLGQEVSKQQQSSDWGAAELSDAQRDYAASDVRFLHAMKDILDARLAREGRMALAQACFDFLPTRAALDLAGWPEVDIFAHS